MNANTNVMGIVLAAGLGKRMKSKLHKVLHPVCGKPMLEHVLDALDAAGVGRKVVVVGHGADAVRGALGGRVEYALQAEQLGTGHAVRVAEPLLGAEDGVTIVVYGDTPLLTAQSLEGMLRLQRESGAAATLLTAAFDDPTGLGRIVRGADGGIERIVEEKDCDANERAIREINAGAYCFDNKKLFEALAQVKNDNKQGEYYLTDVIGIFRAAGLAVQGYCTADADEAFGVNDRVALAEAERLMRARINRAHLLGGVTIVDPAATYIDAGVTIGADTVVYPGTTLRGATHIGEGCAIGPNTDILNSTVADEAVVKHSVLDKAVVGPRTTVGPFANLRPGTRLGSDVKIGDFVEIKSATIDDRSKVSHLAYVGDARVGKDVNIGCGVITVNYDGFSKFETVIEDEAFVGSNVNLVAPVKIGKGAFVVAGSTITQDVGEDDFAIARERQTTKKGYAKTLKARLKAQKNR
ncbi:bifunctional UDP-N-acetylglucosamine diphosphorylase/glucosamine-1-phosphate N-acetyltransferase GlmU [Paenibacillus sp.]|uniref:bifunctional UDP-N-acetylglucosamine diphosphorylase/glucosamine-1-phosphate N-acetyltransferase GlmU n=1 Tax=Paenibacillus sp. TaxID=58172 RepID=UPI002D74BAED|nr:bifunctional UDP-N-acetylglucosamine diphosphorylase/glucosamine-1-phosphate N-acetyltransferase GlmU [Paenibacillus sp.]HZG55808.1 bifunctional UDP-N-acetylglucosamine diphosphorylase/glucosamine-1-phosphate N-acetyltransferase GlmU [Paenibacillus sp.]